MLEVLRPGSRAIVGGDVEATVLAVMLMTDGGLQYKVAWWDGRARCTAWLDPCEVAPLPAEAAAPLQVGFRA